VLRPYDLLENILIDIEEGIREGVYVNTLSEKYELSERHLRRVFKFAFKQSLADYIRSRKLTASLDDLFKTDANLLDIALNYGFCYEQSYINAFKREFGITPGELRKTGQVVKITPPLQLFDSNRLGDGLIFGPEIVMVPQFHIVGKSHKVTFRDVLVSIPPIVKQFFCNERMKISNMVNPDVHINISYKADTDADYHYFMPAAQVRTLDNIPEGFDHYTFPSSLYARFCFINYTLDDLNMNLADGMFNAIDNFMDNENQEFFLERKKINIDKFDISDKYGNYLQWEWFAPVIKKTSLNIAPSNPSGIKKVFQQKLPALRFIGKKCIEPEEPQNVLNLLDNWQLNGWFDVIEKQSGIDYKKLFEGGGAYINLVRKKDGGLYEHWMGMFMPKDTNVPGGYEAIDFPKSTLAVCSVYGKRDEIINYETGCRHKLIEKGFTPEHNRYYFRRFNWRRFFEDDIYGKRVLEYCYFT